MEWETGHLLKDFSTIKVGGEARYYLAIRSIEAMAEALQRCQREKLPFFVLGKGSNCLFDDRGFDGVILHNKIEGCEWLEGDRVRVGAGFSFSLLGVQSARRHLAGLEFASGIPASVGGAVFMNAGANGQETADALSEVEFLDESGKLHLFQRENLNFSYRHSPFQSMKGAIVRATFQLKPCSEAREKQLQILDYRIKTQPYSEPSAGCIFRNPVGNSSGRLIEAAGLKGYLEGDAKVSEKHANFIVNSQQATATDILKLIEKVQKQVHDKSGLWLEPEVRVIPYSGEK